MWQVTKSKTCCQNGVASALRHAMSLNGGQISRPGSQKCGIGCKRIRSVHTMKTLMVAPGLTTSNEKATRRGIATNGARTKGPGSGVTGCFGWDCTRGFASFTSPVKGASWSLCPLLLVASLLLVARPGAPSSVLAPSSDALPLLIGATYEMYIPRDGMTHSGQVLVPFSKRREREAEEAIRQDCVW